MDGEKEKNTTEKLERQTELLEEILAQTEKTRRYLLWLKILGIIKVLIIVTPIVLGIIYLPPFIRKIIEDYKNVVPGLERMQEILESSRQINK